MPRRQITDKADVRRYRRHIVISAMVFIGLFSLTMIVLSASKSLWQEDIDKHTRENAVTQAALLERNLNRSFSAAYILGTLVQQQNGQLKRFDYTAATLLKSLRGISNIQLAPNGVIANIYPLAGQEKAIGHNILKDDSRVNEAQQAVSSRKMTLAGPFELLQGGVAIIARQPVFLSNNEQAQLQDPGEGEIFWGFASTLVFLDDALKMSDLHLLERSGYAYQLWRIHPDSGLVDVFAGNIEDNGHTRARQAIRLPNSIWYLDLVKTGISFSTQWVVVIVLGCMLMSLALSHWVFTMLQRGRELRRIVSARTEQLRTANRTLRQDQLELRKLSNAVEQTGSSVVITNTDGIIEYVNPYFTEITGYSAAEAIGKKTSLINSPVTKQEEHQQLWQTILAGESWYGERQNKRKDGSLYWAKLSISPVVDDDGKIVNFVGVSEDISDDKEENLRMQHLAFHDALTGLPNRRCFVNRLEHVLKHIRRKKTKAALMFIDLDKFKDVNDSLGHDIGDMLLVEVAQRLLSVVRESDTVARLGGDEFMVLLDDVNSLYAAEQVANKLLVATNELVKINDHQLSATISIGITLITADGQFSENQLMRQADIALYQAKQAGRQTYRSFSLSSGE